MRQVVLDTETTGLKTEEGHRIIEIACLEMINRKITGRRYHQYINPMRVVDEGALEVHGITNQFLEGKPVFADIVQAFMEFVEGAELIIHNAPFDIGFINYELKLTQQKWKPITAYCPVIDTLPIARQLHIGQRNSLDALCKRYGIDNSQRDLHGALIDTHLLAQVYLVMTGGQGSLFGESQASEKDQPESNAAAVQVVKARHLVVQQADSEEIQSHVSHLKKMAEKGQCLWSIPSQLI